MCRKIGAFKKPVITLIMSELIGQYSESILCDVNKQNESELANIAF